MPKSPGALELSNRRTFLAKAAGAGVSALMAGQFQLNAAEPGVGAAAATAATGSDVGSLFPFIQRQAVKGEFPLSFLNTRYRSLPRCRPKRGNG